MIGLRKSAAILTIFIMVAGFALPSSTLADEAGGGNLSIQQALDIAAKDNLDQKAADLAEEAAQNARDNAAQNVYWIPTGGMVSPSAQGVVSTYNTTEINLNNAKKTQSTTKESINLKVINAYCSAVQAYNSMETARLTLDDLTNQKNVSSLYKEIGLIGDTDYDQILNSIEQSKQSYANAQLSYNSAIASLGTLLGEEQGWQPILTSHSLLENYQRDELTVELSQAVTQSTAVQTAIANLEIEQSKQSLIISGVSSDSKRISLENAEVSYDQTQRSVRSTIEQLYYNIDTLEGQIKAAETANSQAQQDLKTAQLKYDLGLIPERSSSMSGTTSLDAAKLTVEKDQLSLDNLKSSLVSAKANFAYLTGQTVYQATDWNDSNAVINSK